jgi:hypothetical protein
MDADSSVTGWLESTVSDVLGMMAVDCPGQAARIEQATAHAATLVMTVRHAYDERARAQAAEEERD